MGLGNPIWLLGNWLLGLGGNGNICGEVPEGNWLLGKPIPTLVEGAGIDIPNIPSLTPSFPAGSAVKTRPMMMVMRSFIIDFCRAI